jgi:phage repressor protein C with HTH and peptisase S24 domain
LNYGAFREKLSALAVHFGGKKRLAEAMGWKIQTLSQYLHGSAKPGRAVLERLAKLSGDSLASWHGEEEQVHDPGRFPVFNAGGGQHWIVADGEAPYHEKKPDNLVGFRVRGDSMEPIARDGQIVLVEKGDTVRDGDLAIVELTDGTRTFKRVHRKGRQVILQPVNPSHNADVVPADEVQRMTRVWGVKF